MAEENHRFKPKGYVPEWQRVYTRLLALEIGETVTYEELTRVLRRPFEDGRSPFYTAMRKLQKEKQRTLRNVKGVGYEVVQPREHLGLARSHIRRSHRQLGRASERLEVDRSALTRDERQKVDDLAQHLAKTHGEVLRLNRRASDNERALEEVRRQVKTDKRTDPEDVTELAQKLEGLAEALKRHGVQTTEG